jgi:succinyl-diaminopimelate desuccinylase
MLPTGDLLALTAALVDIPSESHDESRITDLIEAELRPLGHLVVDRVGDNLVARTDLGRGRRIVLAGHTDTVPANGNAAARVEDDVLWGLGSSDMKGGVAILVELARRLEAPAVDVTYIFYACEEVSSEHNGLRQLASKRPELLDADVALLGEPTDGALEAGCQGTLRVKVTLVGERAHTARAWMGRNAIHRLSDVLGVLRSYRPRRPVIGGCEYREALQAVSVEGGIAGNVVPDRVELFVNHRFAPDRTPAAAEAHVREVLGAVLTAEDTIELTDMSPPAAPGLEDPMLRALVKRNSLEIRAKLGWTDVAFFAARGVPASNFGPGDATLAHTAQEHLHRSSLESTYAALEDLLVNGA